MLMATILHHPDMEEGASEDDAIEQEVGGRNFKDERSGDNASDAYGAKIGPFTSYGLLIHRFVLILSYAILRNDEELRKSGDRGEKDGYFGSFIYIAFNRNGSFVGKDYSLGNGKS